MDPVVLYLAIAAGVLICIGIFQGLTDGEDDVVACVLVALFWPVTLSLIGSYALGCLIRNAIRKSV